MADNAGNNFSMIEKTNRKKRSSRQMMRDRVIQQQWNRRDVKAQYQSTRFIVEKSLWTRYRPCPSGDARPAAMSALGRPKPLESRPEGTDVDWGEGIDEGGPSGVEERTRYTRTAGWRMDYPGVLRHTDSRDLGGCSVWGSRCLW